MCPNEKTLMLPIIRQTSKHSPSCMETMFENMFEKSAAHGSCLIVFLIWQHTVLLSLCILFLIVMSSCFGTVLCEKLIPDGRDYL